MSNYPKITKIIQGALSRNDSNVKDLAEKTGIPYATLIQTRFPDPMSWRFCEIKAVFGAVQFYPDEVKDIVKEVGLSV